MGGWRLELALWEIPIASGDMAPIRRLVGVDALGKLRDDADVARSRANHCR